MATDDGSAGHHGLVSDLIEPLVGGSGPAASLVCCGPEPMLKTVSRIAQRLGVPCQVSLETPMKLRNGNLLQLRDQGPRRPSGWDYRRTCVEVRYSTRKIDFD